MRGKKYKVIKMAAFFLLISGGFLTSCSKGYLPSFVMTDIHSGNFEQKENVIVMNPEEPSFVFLDGAIEGYLGKDQNNYYFVCSGRNKFEHCICKINSENREGVVEKIVTFSTVVFPAAETCLVFDDAVYMLIDEMEDGTPSTSFCSIDLISGDVEKIRTWERIGLRYPAIYYAGNTAVLTYDDQGERKIDLYDFEKRKLYNILSLPLQADEWENMNGTDIWCGGGTIDGFYYERIPVEHESAAEKNKSEIWYYGFQSGAHRKIADLEGVFNYVKGDSESLLISRYFTEKPIDYPTALLYSERGKMYQVTFGEPHRKIEESIKAGDHKWLIRQQNHLYVVDKKDKLLTIYTLHPEGKAMLENSDFLQGSTALVDKDNFIWVFGGKAYLKKL